MPILLAVLAASASAQPPRRKSHAEAAGCFRISSDLVLINAAVVDAAGLPVAGIPQDHFRLFEGHAEQRIAYFSEEETPVSLVIVADISGSMKGKLHVCARSAAELFRSTLAGDEFALVTFANRPRLSVSWTQDETQIRSALGNAQAGGTTALLDAVQLGAQYAGRGRNRRKALVVVSDGGDNNSRYSEGEVLRLIAELDVELYAVNIGEPWFSGPTAEGAQGRAALERLCEHASGRFVAVDNVTKLPEAADRINREIRSQYLLGYRPARFEGAGRLHRVDVKVSPPTGMRRLSVNWRRGWREPD